ncbi:MAG TPA: hypothetical protein VLT36_20990, partial [Candidatus Dormibacteraeota bacterium]|nr:hypothetical protein [Candidatus Dormibacteraeota bacterium]
MKHLLLGLALFATLAVSSNAQLFSDNFTRGSDPGPLTPWTVQTGAAFQTGTNWIVTGGTMQSGSNPTFGYANATITNNFTNYTVQGRFQFPAGAFGGGLAGRLNPATGTHYGAWVYPEGSVGGPLILKLIKFQGYSSFSYLGSGGAPMAVANLASVGTG